MKKKLVIIFSLLILSVPLAMASALDDLSRDIADVAQKVSPSVVTITAEKVMKQNPMFEQFPPEFFFFGPQQRDHEVRSKVLGSGVIVGEGIILTNNHVVEDAEDITIHLQDRRELKAELLGTDPASDVAVLKVKEKDLPVIALGNSDDLRVGEFVLAIGSPFSDHLNTTVTLGIVSAKERTGMGILDFENFIQTDAAINPGNSGGPLINSKGELVGINTAIESRSGGNQGIGFAIPVNLARHNMQDIIKEGRVIRAYIGVQIQEVDQDIANSLGLENVSGALVGDVVKDSPGEKAGLKTGDIIQTVNGDNIVTAAQLRMNISTRRPGEKVDLGVFRDGKTRTVTIKLGELPAEKTKKTGDDANTGKLGITVKNIDDTIRNTFRLDKDQQGVIITGTDENSDAAEKGLVPGTIILKIGNQEIADLKEYRTVLNTYKSGDSVLFFVKYRGSNHFIGLTLP